MQVSVVGDDPVREAVVTALDDVDIGVREARPGEIADARFAIVSDVAGSATFDRANEAALEGGTPWIAVEIGGVGNHPLPDVDAAISGFAPATACFDCLRARVASNVEDRAAKPQADRAAARLAGAIAGRECVRVLSGDEESIIGQVREVPHARRQILPVPGCTCAEGERDRTLERDAETLPLETAVEHAEGAIDDRVGPISSIAEVESFPTPYYLSTVADTTAYSDASAPRQAAGVADDWNAALMKAVGEGLERYCAGVYLEADFVHASEDDLEHAVAPTDLVRPDDAPAYDASDVHRWVPGENLATGKETHLPAAAVQFPQPGETLVPAITTGLGLGSSTVDALVSGLTEVIERDATMLAWYSTFEPLGLSVETDAFETLERRAQSEGLSVTPLLVTQDIDVPVVAVAVHRESDALDDDKAISPGDDAWPAFAVGSAAGLDAEAAATSALEEAIQNWMELRSLGPDEAADAGGAIGEYAAFPDRAREFVDVDRTVPAASVGPDPVPSGEARLEELCSRVRDADLTPAAARLTTRDLEALGFEAVRVVVPGAQPLFTDAPFFGERARTVPDELGFESRLERAFHPYP
ncbi:YcaO-like family protein [Natrinema hispanicum]|uniref:Ribosomal protein S12 methylthiotransferase accessory factor n=1 Tax=Natrinema hispanicum TaxID=392421 RepID=A0A1G6Q5N0_9EURY|nr:YcaO-like family protein [Natrinema hispanicum]SDC87649.1 ribosomal protein S12 methylthiotransferase accessory factor [Natrinema hispanicum]SET29777.1 ribosomal protein S12 methylthiotransferase accessory factor [Natrinema hispanicum]